MPPLGPDFFADFEIQSMHLKDHSLILPSLPSQPINGSCFRTAEPRVLRNAISHLLPSGPTADGQPRREKA